MTALNDKEIRELGYMFKKLWNADDLDTLKSLNGFTKALDALGITWTLIPSKEKDFEAVVIAGKSFKL